MTIHITDVNEKPICNEASVYISTDILVDVGAKIGSVSCYDADIDPNNKELLYSITSGDQGILTIICIELSGMLSYM